MSALARPGHAQQSHAPTQLPKRKTGGAAFYRFFVFSISRVLFSRNKASNGRPSGRCQRLRSLRETKTRENRLEKTRHQSNTCTGSHGDRAKPHSSDTPPHSADLGRQSTVTSGLPTTGCSSCHQSPHTTL